MNKKTKPDKPLFSDLEEVCKNICYEYDFINKDYKHSIFLLMAAKSLTTKETPQLEAAAFSMTEEQMLIALSDFILVVLQKTPKFKIGFEDFFITTIDKIRNHLLKDAPTTNRFVNNDNESIH